MRKKCSLFVRCLILLLIAVCCVSCAKSAEAAWKEQYDLGVRYLENGDYEQAVIAFEAAIEIDPKRPEAYSGAAQAYVALGDVKAAIAILEQGYAATNDEALQQELERFSLDDTVDAENTQATEAAGDNGLEPMQNDPTQGESGLPAYITLTETRSYFIPATGEKHGERIFVIEFEAGREWPKIMSINNSLLLYRLIVPEGYHPVSAVEYFRESEKRSHGAEVYFEYEWRYDESGCLIQEIFKYWNGNEHTTTFINDTDGNPVAWEETYSSSEGREHLEKGSFVYDDAGNLIKKALDSYDVYGADGSRIEVEGSMNVFDEEFTYNALGQIESYNQIYYDGSSYEIRYEYDPQGRLVKEIMSSVEDQFDYDEQNHLVERRGFVDGVLVNQGQYVYE